MWEKLKDNLPAIMRAAPPVLVFAAKFIEGFNETYYGEDDGEVRDAEIIDFPVEDVAVN